MRETYGIDFDEIEDGYIGINEARDLTVFSGPLIYNDLRAFKKNKPNLMPWYLHYGIPFLPAKYVWMKMIKPGWLTVSEYSKALNVTHGCVCQYLRKNPNRYTVQDLSDTPTGTARKRLIYAPEFETVEAKLKKLEDIDTFKSSVVLNIQDYIPFRYLLNNPKEYPDITCTPTLLYTRLLSVSEDEKTKVVRVRNYPLIHKSLIEDKTSILYMSTTLSKRHKYHSGVTLADIAKKFGVSREATRQWALKGYLEQVPSPYQRQKLYKDIDEPPYITRDARVNKLLSEGYIMPTTFLKKYNVRKHYLDYYIAKGLVETIPITKKRILIKDPGELPNIAPEDFIPVSELAKNLNVTMNTIYCAVREGRLESTNNENHPGILLVKNVDKIPPNQRKKTKWLSKNKAISYTLPTNQP